uniref:Uncharacterized protein n=1 Tax=Anguilla anguilla TaxID=7936 RepID=A0A0E9SLU4_ANGAN
MSQCYSLVYTGYSNLIGPLIFLWKTMSTSTSNQQQPKFP